VGEVHNTGPRHAESGSIIFAGKSILFLELFSPNISTDWVTYRMDLTKFPSDLSNESTAALMKIAKLVQAELDQRGGFEGKVYTFIKRKVSGCAVMIMRDHSVAMDDETRLVTTRSSLFESVGLDRGRVLVP
jgi:hypothetical protein